MELAVGQNSRHAVLSVYKRTGDEAWKNMGMLTSAKRKAVNINTLSFL